MSKCRIAAGKIYFKDLSLANQPYLFLGNAQANAAITEETQEQPDYTSVSGGNACSVRDISNVELTLTMYDFDKKNLALAVFGSYSAPAGGTATNEAVDLFQEGITPLSRIYVSGANLMVGVTPYVLDTDYTVSGGGIQVIPGSALDTAIAGTGVGTPKRLAGEFDYTYSVEDAVEALVTSGKTFALMLECKNKADGAKYEVWRFHKVQFGPTGALAIITREFGSFEITGEVLQDTTQTVPGESQYFTIQQAQ